MRRYPSRNGLAIPPYELGLTIPTPDEIYYRETNNHHHYYHSYNYTDPLGSIFRNLVHNLSPLLRDEHTWWIHDRYEAPRRPKPVLMIDVIEETLAMTGCIEVVLKKCTNQTRFVDLQQWDNLKNGVKLAA